jgi:hypothetical protein
MNLLWLSFPYSISITVTGTINIKNKIKRLSIKITTAPIEMLIF